MFISCIRNVIVPSPDGCAAYPIPIGYVGDVPDWVGETAYFRALVKDGKIGVPDSRKDKDVENQLKRKPTRRGPADAE